jgi:hypothetical protein
MAHHTVKITIPVRKIGYTDIEFAVYQNKSKIGQLNVSQGAVAWIPSGKVLGRKLSWIQFDELMSKKGAKSRVRKTR